MTSLAIRQQYLAPALLSQSSFQSEIGQTREGRKPSLQSKAMRFGIAENLGEVYGNTARLTPDERDRRARADKAFKNRYDKQQEAYRGAVSDKFYACRRMQIYNRRISKFFRYFRSALKALKAAISGNVGKAELSAAIKDIFSEVKMLSGVLRPMIQLMQDFGKMNQGISKASKLVTLEHVRTRQLERPNNPLNLDLNTLDRGQHLNSGRVIFAITQANVQEGADFITTGLDMVDGVLKERANKGEKFGPENDALRMLKTEHDRMLKDIGALKEMVKFT